MTNAELKVFEKLYDSEQNTQTAIAINLAIANANKANEYRDKATKPIPYHANDFLPESLQIERA